MIDDEIIINKEKLPKLIQECIKKLEYYNEINDDIMYISELELLETTAKSYAINEQLSQEEYNRIMRKYGGEI